MTTPSSGSTETRGARSWSPVLTARDDVRGSCDLPDDAASAPRFDDDSATLRERGDAILVRVASCFAAGRFGDRKLVLVGFTDPRGSERYNEALGLYRAQAARLRLLELGVPDESIVVESRGESDATGAAAAEWPRHRRVEIELAPAAPPESPR